MPSGRLFTIAAVRERARPANTDTLTTSPLRHPSTRRAGFGVLVLAALLSLLALAGPAAGAQSCARQVINDWYDDGRIDGTYPLHCYDDAIEILPPDVRDYSSAEEDIGRALQAAMRKEPAPPATRDPSPDEGEDPAVTPPDDETPTTTGSSTPRDDGEGGEAAPTVDADESASSVPIPLLILAGLALLLVAGGSAGYLVRRFHGRQIPPAV